MAIELQDFSWKRMVEAVDAVHTRTRRAASALQEAGIPYAVAGGNAVAAWVARVDRAAVRNTQDIDILVNRADFDAIKVALERAGFVYQDVFGVDCFLDGPAASPRDAIHLIFAGEKVRPDHPTVSADVTDVVTADDFQVVSLDALVRMKLNSFRRKDQVHLLDLLSVGLIDSSWLMRLVPAHAARLQELIDDPEG